MELERVERGAGQYRTPPKTPNVISRGHFCHMETLGPDRCRRDEQDLCERSET